jgi:hypothetical protein
VGDNEWQSHPNHPLRESPVTLPPVQLTPAHEAHGLRPAQDTRAPALWEPPDAWKQKCKGLARIVGQDQGFHRDEFLVKALAILSNSGQHCENHLECQQRLELQVGRRLTIGGPVISHAPIYFR